MADGRFSGNFPVKHGVKCNGRREVREDKPLDRKFRVAVATWGSYVQVTHHVKKTYMEQWPQQFQVVVPQLVLSSGAFS